MTNKILYLIRHAKSSWEDRSVSDFDRTLNERGLKDAPLMARLLKAINVRPDLVISSPAKRCLLTAEIFCGILEYPQENIRYENKIYDAGVKELMEVLAGISDNIETVILFGHNPGLSTFSNLLGNKFIGELPTCGIIGLNFGTTQWNKCERGCGKIFIYEYPKKQK